MTGDTQIGNQRPQFGLGGMLLAVTAAALFLGSVMAATHFLGAPPSVAASALAQQALKLPVLLVWMVGGIMLVHRWEKHPGVSRFALLALAGFFLLTVADSLFNVWLQVRAQTVGPRALTTAVLVCSISSSGVSAVCWGLLLTAVLGWRASDR